jgi:hypothetical protein
MKKLKKHYFNNNKYKLVGKTGVPGVKPPNLQLNYNLKKLK